MAKFLPLFYIIKSITVVNIIKNEKLNKENRPTYLAVLFGLCLTYSLKVIKLASEDISVPTPPTFTPTSNAW